MPLARTLRYARRFRNWREITRATRSGEKPTHLVMRDDTRFQSPRDTNVVRPVAGVFFKHVYTPRGYSIGSQDAVVDIGANFGSFTVFAAQRTRGPVVAVEPHPENRRFLDMNLEANDCRDVRVLPYAVTDHPGTVKLFPGHSGTTHQLFAGGRDVVPGNVLEVAGVPLDTVLDEAGLATVDFLKIDCEGAEGLFLPATSAETLARIRKIAMEFHDDTSPVSHQEIAALLINRGFAVDIRWDGQARTGMLYARR